ncbi:glutamate-rich protein 2 [Menidia menidia]
MVTVVHSAAQFFPGAFTVWRRSVDTAGVTCARPAESCTTGCARVDERGRLGKFPDGGLESKEPKNPRHPDSALTGGSAHADEPLPQLEENGQKEQTKPEDKDGDLKAPVELMMKFLKALVDKEFELASRLCQMILIYEPHNPEASQFLPLIRRKLLEESEQSDEKTSSASDSSSSCSSSSSDDNDEEDEDEDDGSTHKPCPPS